MRKIILFIVFLSCYLLSAQDDSGTFSNAFIPTNEINHNLKLPKSPEAEAFEKYGNTAVNIYTGTPDINIPLQTLKGRELDFPISLTYDASGIKVTQLATCVGLGWNLNVGGRISRIANGRPDDIASSPYSEDVIPQILQYRNQFNFSSEYNLEDYLNNFMLENVQGYIDTEIDFTVWRFSE